MRRKLCAAIIAARSWCFSALRSLFGARCAADPIEANVSDRRFKPDCCYFLVGYLDKKFQFPFVQSYVFIGVREQHWLFQDVRSYFKEGRQERSDEDKGIDVMSLDEASLDAMLSPRELAEEFERLAI
jgi:hypothetical protein